MDKNLDTWFNSLDLKQLMRLFCVNPGQNANDFVYDCDEYWQSMTQEEKQLFCEYATTEI